MSNSKVSGFPKTITANLDAKTITENGTYNPIEDNLDGYNQVTVNVVGEATDMFDLFLTGNVDELDEDAALQILQGNYIYIE